MKKNQGISLISLIITIIVIIVLAAIVIFNGFGTLGRAQLADFSSQVASLGDATQDKYGNLFSDYATSGTSRTREQIYYQIATGIDSQEGTYMNGYTLKATSEPESGKDYQNIRSLNTEDADVKEGGFDELEENIRDVGKRIGMSLPNVRGKNDGWCITKEGQVFNASGFYDEGSGRTYFTANLYTRQQLPSLSTKDDGQKTKLEKRAEQISKAILGGYVGNIDDKDEYKITEESA